MFDGKVYQGFVDCFDILRALLSLVDIRSLTEENRDYKLRAAGTEACTAAFVQHYGSWLTWQHRWLVLASTAAPLLRCLSGLAIPLSTVLRAGLQLEHQQLRSLNISQDGALIYKADLQSTLHDVVLYGFLQPDSAGCLRVSAFCCTDIANLVASRIAATLMACSGQQLLQTRLGISSSRGVHSVIMLFELLAGVAHAYACSHAFAAS